MLILDPRLPPSGDRVETSPRPLSFPHAKPGFYCDARSSAPNSPGPAWPPDGIGSAIEVMSLSAKGMADGGYRFRLSHSRTIDLSVPRGTDPLPRTVP